VTSPGEYPGAIPGRGHVLVAQEHLDPPEVVASVAQGPEQEVPEGLRGRRHPGLRSPPGRLRWRLVAGVITVPGATIHPGMWSGSGGTGSPESGTALEEVWFPEGRTDVGVRRPWRIRPALAPRHGSWDPPWPYPEEPPRWAQPTASPALLSSGCRPFLRFRQYFDPVVVWGVLLVATAGGIIGSPFPN
jgi:hypothetical protein